MGKKVFFLVFFCLMIFFTASLTYAAIHVSNYLGNDVATWPNSTTGNTMPTTDISGPLNTTLDGPFGVAVDANWIYVANTLGNSILVFPIGATGDTAPTRTISGPLFTTLNAPIGVAVD